MPSLHVIRCAAEALCMKHSMAPLGAVSASIKPSQNILKVDNQQALQDAEVKTGNLGFGNKGAVLVRLRVYDEPLTVICAHLASGEHSGDDARRLADFGNVLAHGRFGNAAQERSARDTGVSHADERVRCVQSAVLCVHACV